ncbi:TetR/AcrR family transcriptional regulator [Desulfitobacterium chlororespirans]|uniref:Transcriptional regulator, TetR family n=1 Tax=Desulfitobacterium chlororespirans DSM 11544 TaxID=1121395 RepID=A0A1M7SFZ0_9FIRM|nr:TetR/AcrR family transcriptional regulator [Desulfitobacterium chlororespirans]SHN57391.1 transcriptional regulator, TetR family [Desulfitobacterium chlororespirans DSM 11544]
MMEKKEIGQSEKILNAAVLCISTKGYASVSLRDIADEAGVVLSQVNYYYKNKEGLFIEVIRALAQRYLQELEDKLSQGKSEEEKRACLIEFFQDTLLKNPGLFKLLFDVTSMALWSDTFREPLRQLFDDSTALIEKYIIKNIAPTQNSNGYSPSVLSRITLGALFGTSIHIMLAGEPKDAVASLSAIKVLLSN